MPRVSTVGFGTMRRGWLLALLLTARSAAAHIVPVPPSACVFDPLTIDAPSAGTTATAAPPAAADQFRILYDPQASDAQFDLTGVPPRSFTVGGVTGTVAFPSVFLATLLNTGDLTATVPLTFTLGGGATSVTMTLTTGLAAAGDTIVEGAPIGADGRFTLVGITDQSRLGPPLAGPLLAIQMSCQATPRPDTDQFRAATPLSASLNARKLKLRTLFITAPGDSPNFAAAPAILRATSGSTDIATVLLASGLPAKGRKLFIGRTADGRMALGVRALKRQGQTEFLLALKVKNPTPPPAGGNPVNFSVVYTVGGVTGRIVLPMKRRGALLHYP